MATRLLYRDPVDGHRDRGSFLVPIIIIWAIVAAAVFSFIWMDAELGSTMHSLYLLPWTFLAGACVLASACTCFM